MKVYYRKIPNMHAYSNYRQRIIKSILLLCLLLFEVGCTAFTASNSGGINEPNTPISVGNNNYPLTDEEVQRWPDEVVSLNDGQAIAAELGTGNGLLTDNTPFDLYQFAGEIGDSVTISLSSTVFDAYLILVDANGRIILTNDDVDPKSNTDATLSLYLPEDGDYRVLVNSNTGETGNYQLTLNTIPQLEKDDQLRINQPVNGWLKPGDRQLESGVYADYWKMTLLDEPIIVWMKSNEFDTYLRAWLPDGREWARNDDQSFVGRQGNARLYLEPTADVPAGTEITLEASMPSLSAIGGAYQMIAVSFPNTFEPVATLTIKPVVVNLPVMAMDTQTIEQEFRNVIDYTRVVWQQCNIDIVVLDDQIHYISIEDFPDKMHVSESEWTPDEDLLQQHPIRTFAYDSVVTVFVIPQFERENYYGVSYPSTRYPPRRSGMNIIAKETLTDPAHFVTLAHELGHILGLEHPSEIDGDGDGDPWNDALNNVMSTQIHDGETIPDTTVTISPLQCITARAAHHYLQVSSAPVPDLFTHVERVLTPNEQVIETLTTQDEKIQDDGHEYFLDVFYFHGEAGETFAIELTSIDFDPYLILENSAGAVIMEEDDDGTSRNAFIEVTLLESDDYSIGVTSYLPLERGAYQLYLNLISTGSK